MAHLESSVLEGEGTRGPEARRLHGVDHQAGGLIAAPTDRRLFQRKECGRCEMPVGGRAYLMRSQP